MDQIKLPPSRPEIKDDEQQNIVGNESRASWQFSLDTLRANIAPYSADAQEAIVSAFLWCTDPLHPVPKPDFAIRVGSSDNTIYKILAGKYRHPETNATLSPSPALIKSIKDFLALEKKRFLAGETKLVKTETLGRIETLCDLARESQTISFLVGPSHIGKTWALEKYYTPKNNHGKTTYIRMETASGLGGMVRAIARELSISEKSNTADLTRRIKKAITPDMLIILDELHLLANTYRKGSFFACVEAIREIHDVTKCGMVWCFTNLDEVRAASQKELQQVWRRSVHKLTLPNMPTINDLTAILKHNGLEFPSSDLEVQIRFRDSSNRLQTIEEKPREVLRQLAKNEALLAITERLRYAGNIARKSGIPLNWSHFIDAHLRIVKQSQPKEEWI